MYFLKSQIKAGISVILIGIFLLGCNSDDSNGSSGKKASAPMAINEQSATNIAAMYLGSKYDNFSDTLNDSNGSTNKSPLAKTKNLQKNLQGRALTNGEIIACDISGNYTFSGDVNTGIGTYTFNNCKTNYFDGSTETENGKIIIIGAGSFIDGIFNGSFQFDSYTVQTENPTGFEKYEGKINVEYDFGLNTIVYIYKISGQALSMTENDNNFTLYDYLLGYEGDTSTNIDTLESSYTLESNLLEGSLKLETLKPVKYYNNTVNQSYPFEGVILFTGAGNSQLKMTVIEGGTGAPTDSLQVQVDADGDGIFEYDVTDTWENWQNGTVGN